MFEAEVVLFEINNEHFSTIAFGFHINVFFLFLYFLIFDVSSLHFSVLSDAELQDSMPEHSTHLVGSNHLF